MTLENCAAFCAGYKYFGAEYSTECYCGNTLAPSSANASSLDECSMPCSGNPYEYCGGPNRLELYSTDNYTAPSGPSQPATVRSSSSSGTTWNFHQCIAEPTTGGVRALSADVHAADDLTLEDCAAYCEEYAYFGAEYGRECYCGNELAAGAEEAPAGDCSMACAGDEGQLCGNGNRLSVYSKAA
jgi:hypothetical protein